MDPSVDITLPNEATALLDALVHAGHGAAVVGGAVRDAALGRALRDLDVVTSASPAEVESACVDQWWCRRVFAVGERYGTVGVVLSDGTVVEVSRLRGSGAGDEVSHGAANAAPTEASGLQDFGHAYAVDAAHRDFTVNALAAQWPGMELLDPTGGLADLDSRLLRTPGDPVQRFTEDPLRVLRAARFVAELGFTVDPAAADALATVAPNLSRIAVERVRDELTALLVAPHVEAGLNVLQDSGALAVVLPELAPLDGLAQPSFHDLDVLSHTIQAVGVIPPRPVLRWAALLHDVGKAPARTVDEDGRIRFFRHAFIGAEIAEEICRRLRLSNADRVAIVHLVREHMRWGEVPLENLRAVDKAVRRLDLWADGASPPRRLVSAEDALELELADFAGTAHRTEADDRRRSLEEALRASRERGTRLPPATPLSGRELIRELGLPEGPCVGAALRAISGAVAEGRVSTRDRDGALEVAREAVRRLESNASHKDSATVRVTSAPSICEEDAGRNSAGTNCGELMVTDVVLTVTGPDRTGIVEDVTAVLLEAQGNVGTSRMARLGGEFAILMLVTLPCAEATGLERRFKDLAAQGYHVTATPTRGAGDAARTGWSAYRIDVVGADHEGIVHQIARDLAERDINIETMETGTTEAAVSGTQLFTMTAVVMVSPELDVTTWLSDIAETADAANVDVTVTALD